MADILKDISFDEHYIISSEVAASPSSTDALKGFAIGTTAGRLLSPAELMASKGSQPDTVLRQRIKRDLEKAKPLVSNKNTTELIKDIAANSNDIISTPTYVTNPSNIDNNVNTKRMDILKTKNELLENQVIKFKNEYEGKLKEVSYLREEILKLKMNLNKLNGDNQKLKSFLLSKEQGNVSKGYKDLSRNYSSRNKPKVPVNNPYIINFLEGKVDILHEEMKQMKQNTGRQLNLRNKRA